MPFGIEITAQNGKVFATPETPFMHMTKKMVLNLSGTHNAGHAQLFNTGLDQNLRCIPYIKSSNANNGAWARLVRRSGTWWLEMTSVGTVTATVYLFTNQIPPGSHGSGIELYAADGTRVYSSSTMPLQDFTYAFPNTGGTVTHNVGFPCACIPTPARWWVQRIQGGALIQLFVGTPLAVGNTLYLVPNGTGILPGDATFSFAGYGGGVHYIRTDLYD